MSLIKDRIRYERSLAEIDNARIKKLLLTGDFLFLDKTNRPIENEVTKISKRNDE